MDALTTGNNEPIVKESAKERYSLPTGPGIPPDGGEIFSKVFSTIKRTMIVWHQKQDSIND
jgi:hypothetical protein